MNIERRSLYESIVEKDFSSTLAERRQALSISAIGLRPGPRRDRTWQLV